jgi:hypothetical protein
VYEVLLALLLPHHAKAPDHTAGGFLLVRLVPAYSTVRRRTDELVRTMYTPLARD